LDNKSTPVNICSIFRLLKILAVKFKLLGDVAVMLPSLRAIHEHWPEAELHVLVREEAVPVLENIPWIHRVWGMPKRLGNGGLKRAWNTVRILRKLRFERSVDFEGNDRGAFLSLVVGAKIRLGSLAAGGFIGRRFCYSVVSKKAPNGIHEVYRDIHTLQGWNVPPPSSFEPEVCAAPELAGVAGSLLPRKGAILAHLSTSQPKKEWPVDCWAQIAIRAAQRGIPLVFSSGVSTRERELLERLATLCPNVSLLPQAPDLRTFIAVIARSSVFVSGDTGPLHLAAGLGVKTIGIFGPSDMGQWLPLSKNCRGFAGFSCECSGHARTCESTKPCIKGVSVEAVWETICESYDASIKKP
jgi:ADP-heptose:LPS heptosyltransferase